MAGTPGFSPVTLPEGGRGIVPLLLALEGGVCFPVEGMVAEGVGCALDGTCAVGDACVAAGTLSAWLHPAATVSAAPMRRAVQSDFFQSIFSSCNLYFFIRIQLNAG
jgi:hypothetical protein